MSEEQQQSKQHFTVGTYTAKAIEGAEQFGKTANGGDQVVIELELVDGPNAGDRVSTFLHFTDAAAPYSLERLRALGWEGGEGLVGIGKNEVQIRIAYEVYDGKPKLKVDILTGNGRVVLKEVMGEPEKRGFMAKLNELAAKVPVGSRSSGDGTAFNYGANAQAAVPPGPPIKAPKVTL